LPDLRNQLSLLETSNLIRVATLEPELEYLFRHALIQDAAYDSLLRADRKKLHQAVGGALEHAYPDREGEHVGIIAEHYLLGGNWHKAAEYLIYAADAAVARYSDIEARAYFIKALDALSHLPDSSDTLRQRADSLQKLVNASIVAEPTEVTMARLVEAESAARALVAETNSAEDKYLLARVLYQVGHVCFWSGEPAKALSLFDEVIAAATELGDEALAVYPANISGQMMALAGQLQPAAALLERARNGFIAVGNTVEIIACQGNLGCVLAEMGRIEEGLAEARAALQVAIDTDNMTGLTIGTILLANAEAVSGLYHQSTEHSAEGVRLARLSQNPHYERNALFTGLFAKLQLGWNSEIEADLRLVAEIDRKLGLTMMGQDLSLTLLAWASLSFGEFEKAVDLAAQVVQIAESTGSIFALAWAHRIWGEALYRLDPAKWDAVEQHLTTGLDLHEQRVGRMNAAHVHRLWSRLCRERGDIPCAEAHFEAAKAILTAAGAAEELERLQHEKEGSNG
jgi:tetratricopeptide (TPR) repeat protein